MLFLIVLCSWGETLKSYDTIVSKGIPHKYMKLKLLIYIMINTIYYDYDIYYTILWCILSLWIQFIFRKTKWKVIPVLTVPWYINTTKINTVFPESFLL